MALRETPLCFCSPVLAQFREPAGTTVARANRLETHVEGNLRQTLAISANGRVTALCFSPQGNYLAVATATSLTLFNEVGAHKVFWDGSREPQVLFEDRPPIKAVLVFSNDGKQLFFCGTQGLAMWSWPEGLSLDHNPVRGWTAPDVYNVAVVESSSTDGDRVLCAVKRGSSHFVQLRSALDGKLLWEKDSGLSPITSLQGRGLSVRCVVGNLTGSQCFWSDYDLADGKRTLPVDLGTVSGFSASQSPDGKSLAVVSREMRLIDFETSQAKAAIAPYHPPVYRRRYYSYDWPYYSYRWPYNWTIDTGWTTLFSPDGNTVVTLGKEAVFYTRSTGAIESRVFYSNNPFPLPPATQAEADGIGGFSPDGKKFALVRQSRVAYSLARSSGTREYRIQRQVQGNSAIEIYALGGK